MFLDMFAKNLEKVSGVKGVLFLSGGKKLDYIGEYVFDKPFYISSPTVESEEKTSKDNIQGVIDAPNLYLVIDPGHGGVSTAGSTTIDPGAYNWAISGSVKEKDAVLDIAQKLKNYATLATSIKMTRTGDDTSLTNSVRTSRINSSGGNLLVSIHNNSACYTDSTGKQQQNHTAKGISTLYYDSNDKIYAENVHYKAKDAYFGTTYGYFENDGIAYQNLFVLRDTTVNGCLVEAGYISNTSHDYNVIANASYRTEIAYKIWLGIRYGWWRY